MLLCGDEKTIIHIRHKISLIDSIGRNSVRKAVRAVSSIESLRVPKYDHKNNVGSCDVSLSFERIETDYVVVEGTK